MASSNCGKQARCMLVDTPVPLFQAILQQLTQADHLWLRVVSRSVCHRISQQVASIILRLCANSSTQHVQQWFKDTQRLQHVSKIYVHVTGAISAEVFELAMQLLSQRSAVTELHLLDAGTVHVCLNNSQARIASFGPLQYILGSLQTLVIKGISVDNLPNDLQYLAATAVGQGGWQLQHLTLHIEWLQRSSSRCASDPAPCLWSTFSTAVMNLAASFPHLQQLAFRMPPIGLMVKQAHNAPSELVEAFDALSRTSGLFPIFAEGSKLSSAAALLSAVAGLADGVLQLSSLEMLTVSDVPDIWNVCESSLVGDAPSVVELTTGAGTDQGAAAADSFFSNSQLTTATAAAKAFKTLDDVGCWLLQQHPVLKQASIKAAFTQCSMSWRRRSQRQLPLSDSNKDRVVNRTAAAELVDAALHVDTGQCGHLAIDAASDDQYLTSMFTRQLSHYSFRPAEDVMSHISSCHLTLIESDVRHGLGALLGDLKSLKHLEVSVAPDSMTGSLRSAAAVITAAAAASDLESLSLCFCGESVTLPADALLPLTAAAGGPGSSLQKLVLTGGFATDTAGDSEWLQGLKQLNGLLELSIGQGWGLGLLEVPVDCLPSSPTAFYGSNLVMLPGPGVAALDAGVAAADPAADSDNEERACESSADSTASVCPQLQRLQLDCCRLINPNKLASDELQQLDLGTSSWPGGWAAAATAWPNTRDLSADVSDNQWGNIIDHSITSTVQGTPATSSAQIPEMSRDQLESLQMMQEISNGFQRLRCLTCYRLPGLSVEVLQPLQLLNLKHIELTVARKDSSSSGYTHQERTAVQGWLRQHKPWACSYISWQ